MSEIKVYHGSYCEVSIYANKKPERRIDGNITICI